MDLSGFGNTFSCPTCMVISVCKTVSLIQHVINMDLMKRLTNICGPYGCPRELLNKLTHWKRVTPIIWWLSPGRQQAIIWTNAAILLIGPLGTNFTEILLEIYTFLLKKIHFKMSFGKWRPSCLGLNVLIQVAKKKWKAKTNKHKQRNLSFTAHGTSTGYIHKSSIRSYNGSCVVSVCPVSKMV